MSQVKKQYPAVTGLTWHRTQYYSFFVPKHWHRLEWADERDGVVYAPDQSDPQTVFAVDIRDLGTRLSAEDLEALSEGFYGAVRQLPNVHLESHNQRISSSLLELEAKYTFQEEGETRKRWVRAFYYLGHQIIMTAQGATIEKYDYWLPWFFEAMMTAKVHSTKPESPL